MQVDEIADHVKVRDLPPPGGEHFVAGGKAFQEQAAVGGAVALLDDVLVGANLSHFGDGVLQHLFFFVREPIALFEFADEGACH